MNTTQKLAARYLEAFEFDTKNQLKEYLKEHPGADRALHHVKAPGAGKKPAPEEDTDKSKGKGVSQAPKGAEWTTKMEPPTSCPTKKGAVGLAARYLEAMEFDTPEALHKYLKEHPGADKTLHKVKPPKDEEDDDEDAPKEEETYQCPHCRGSGDNLEGHGTCRWCKGTGIKDYYLREDDGPDRFEDDDR